MPAKAWSFSTSTGMERHFADDGSRRGSRARSRAISDTRPPTPDSSELRLARAALRACDAVSLPARVGIAASKLAARVAAELPKSPTVVAPGEEATFLAPLPLTRLSPELEAAAMLQRFGLASIGDLAKLPESEIASRLGEVGRELHWAARGIDPRPLMPRPLPPEFREGMELEWPLVALEPFLFIANAALDRLSKRMEIQGFACKRLEFTLTLDPEGYDARGIDLPAPTRDVKTMLTLMRLDLEKTPPGAPVVGFSFVAHPDRPRRAQLSLFGPSAVSPEKLATTIAKLVSILGDGRVGMPMTVDGHLPERYAINVFSPPPPPDMKRTPARARGLLAVRTFRPPIPIEVTTREAEGDDVQIASIRSIADEISDPRPPTPNSRSVSKPARKSRSAARCASAPVRGALKKVGGAIVRIFASTGTWSSSAAASIAFSAAARSGLSMPDTKCR